MYDKSFNIFISCRFSKFLFINKLYPLGGEQSLGSGISLLGEFFFGKLDFNVTKGKEKHVKNHFHADLGQQKTLLKEIKTTKFIKNLESDNNHVVGL